MAKAAICRVFGQYPTTNVWPLSSEHFYATKGDRLYRSGDAGKTWDTIRYLPSSSGPMGVLPTGFCMVDGTLYVGEYPLDNSVEPRILRSDDQGETWTAIPVPDVRHIHCLTVDPFTREVWVTTGDANHESAIGRLTDDGIDIVGSGSQLWRAVDLAFTPEEIIWGMDCPYADENHIVKLSRSEIELNNPSVELLHTNTSPFYFAETISINAESHVFFSTAIEPATKPHHTASIIHSSTADGFDTWRILASFDRASPPLDSVISTNAYVFLASHFERGLFFNPYNTNIDSGTIKNVSISRLRDLVN